MNAKGQMWYTWMSAIILVVIVLIFLFVIAVYPNIINDLISAWKELV